MKTRRILLVIFLSSFLLLLPVFSPTYEAILFPTEPLNLVISVNSPQVDITSDIVAQIELKVTYLNPELDRLAVIYDGAFFEELSLSLQYAGNYLFEFYSVQLGEITINQSGVYIQYPITIGALGLIVLIHRYILRFRNVSPY